MQRFLALCKVLKKSDRFNYNELNNYLTIISETEARKKVGFIGGTHPFSTGEYFKYEITPMLKEIESMQYSHLSKKEREAKIVDIRREPKINRNSICTCGSGKKYKKCCLIINN